MFLKIQSRSNILEKRILQQQVSYMTMEIDTSLVDPIYKIVRNKIVIGLGLHVLFACLGETSVGSFLYSVEVQNLAEKAMPGCKILVILHTIPTIFKVVLFIL